MSYRLWHCNATVLLWYRAKRKCNELLCVRLTTLLKYLVSNFDVQGENNDDEQVVKDANRCCQGRRQFQWWCRWSSLRSHGCWQDSASGRHLSTRMSWRRSRHHSTAMRSPSLLEIISLVISLSNLSNELLYRSSKSSVSGRGRSIFSTSATKVLS